jgi:hypothetical protein
MGSPSSAATSSGSSSSDAKGVANDGRDAAGADDLQRELCQRFERADNIHDLEFRLPAAHDALLAREHDHRHGAEQRVSRPGRQVQRAGTERCDADAGLTGQTAIGRGHEGRPLLVPGQDQLDRGVAQALDNIEIFLAGNAEDAVDAFVLKRGDQ